MLSCRECFAGGVVIGIFDVCAAAMSSRVQRTTQHGAIWSRSHVLAVNLPPRQRYPLRSLLTATEGPELSTTQYEASAANFEVTPFMSDVTAVNKLRQESSEFVSRVQCCTDFQTLLPSEELLVSEYELACLTRLDEYAEYLGVNLIRLFDRIFPFSPKSFLSLLLPFAHGRDIFITYVAARLPSFSIWDMAEIESKDQIQIYRRYYFLHQIWSSRKSEERQPSCGSFSSPDSPSDRRVVLMIRELIGKEELPSVTQEGERFTKNEFGSSGCSRTTRQSELFKQLMEGVEDIPVRGIYEALEWLQWIIDSSGSLSANVGIEEGDFHKNSEEQSVKLNNDRTANKRRHSLISRSHEQSPSVDRNLTVKKRKLNTPVKRQDEKLTPPNTSSPPSNGVIHSMKEYQPIIDRLKFKCLSVVSLEVPGLSENIIDVSCLGREK